LGSFQKTLRPPGNPSWLLACSEHFAMLVWTLMTWVNCAGIKHQTTGVSR